MSILDKNKLEDLKDYLKKVVEIRPDFDSLKAYDVTLAALAYYTGKTSPTEISGPALENRWYESLRLGIPDYSVYNDDFFVSDVWACWVIYSRKYLLNLKNPNILPGGVTSIVDWISPYIRSVIDLGCGFGYTTAGLKELFPNASVFGTNIENTFQFKIASNLGGASGFQIFTDIDKIGSTTDLVFASEYFEHHKNPIEHLLHVIRFGRPRFLVIANAFGSRSVGHFDSYNFNGIEIPNKKIGRIFNQTLRNNGFRSVKTKLWNNRPALWVKDGLIRPNS